MVSFYSPIQSGKPPPPRQRQLPWRQLRKTFRNQRKILSRGIFWVFRMESEDQILERFRTQSMMTNSRIRQIWWNSKSTAKQLETASTKMLSSTPSPPRPLKHANHKTVRIVSFFFFTFFLQNSCMYLCIKYPWVCISKLIICIYLKCFSLYILNIIMIGRIYHVLRKM